MSSGGPLVRLLEGPSSRIYLAAFSGKGAASVLLGELPDGPGLMGPTLVAAGLAALVVSRAHGRRLALFLWACLGAIGFAVALWASGLAPPLMASPVEAGVLAALAWAVLAGLAVEGALERLSRSGRQAIAAAALLSLLAALAAGSMIPPLAGGDYAPRRVQGEATGPVGDISALLGSQVVRADAGKVLWVGDDSENGPSLLGPPGDLHTSGAQGPILTDIWPQEGVGPGVTRSVASVASGGTDRAGRDLASWDIRYIVVGASGPEGADLKRAWLSQRDLAVVRDEPGYLLLANAGVAPGPLP